MTWTERVFAGLTPSPVHPPAFVFAFLPSLYRRRERKNTIAWFFHVAGFHIPSLERYLDVWQDHGYDTMECNFCVNRLEILANVFVSLPLPLSLSLEISFFISFRFKASSTSLDRKRGMIPRRRSNGPKERERRRRCDSSEWETKGNWEEEIYFDTDCEGTRRDGYGVARWGAQLSETGYKSSATFI